MVKKKQAPRYADLDISNKILAGLLTTTIWLGFLWLFLIVLKGILNITGVI
jgi:hypothetical protein